MLFNSIVVLATALFGVANARRGSQGPLRTRATGLTIKFYDDGACNTGEGTPANFESETCYPTDGKKGMHIDGVSGCALRAYDGGTCDDSGNIADLDARSCWDISSRGSFKITCS